MVTLSRSLIEASGFIEYPVEDSLDILFRVMQVYSVSGVRFGKESGVLTTEVISFGKSCSVVITNSIDDASLKLIGEPYFNKDGDEAKFIKEKEVFPPFLIVYFKESKAKILQGGYRKEADGNIYLYDGFPEGKVEIKTWIREELPSIIVSLMVQFSSDDAPVNLVPVHRAIFGKTKDGKSVFDIKAQASSPELTISKNHNAGELETLVKQSANLCSKVNTNEIRNLYSAFNEKDKLKQFLSYFHFVERFTHKNFETLSEKPDLSTILQIPDRLESSGDEFFKGQFRESKNILQRFNWCALVAWENVTDDDMDFFKEAKTLRDKISHGAQYDVTTLPVRKLRNLAFKLVRTK